MKLNEQDRGRNNFTPDEIGGCFLFEPAADADISIVVGPLDKKREVAPLVLCCFHNMTSPMLTEKEKVQLYKDVQSMAGKNGFECIRCGGSSGKTTVDKTLMGFLSDEKVFPRNSRMVKLCRHENHWECIYLSPFDRRNEVPHLASTHPHLEHEYTRQEKWNLLHPQAPVDEDHPFMPAKFTYSPPKRGGSFKATLDLFQKYPVLFEFVELKQKAAYLLRDLTKSGFLSIAIAPNAVLCDLSHTDVSVAKLRKGELDFLPSHWTSRQRVLFDIALQNVFTMVTHAVGLHRDTFKVDEGLENKLCFILPRQGHSIGRGGFGYNYVWALLDWANRPAGYVPPCRRNRPRRRRR
jgi:hypothetical protein